MTELHQLSLPELAGLLRTRQVSPVDVTRHALARIETHDAALRSFITVTAAEAIAAAERAEQDISHGAYRGPLHGVPLGLKDLFDMAGVPTTFGSRILSGKVATADAAVVATLRAAGAIFLGKHNLHEFAFGVTSENPHYGACANPWDTSRIAGGSSGGTAAALGAGLCWGGFGTDTGGSIRIPAGLSGVAGFKPTYDRLSRQGALPMAPSLDHVGPMARTAAGCALLFDAAAGTTTLQVDEAGLQGLRIGVAQDFFKRIQSGVHETVLAAIETLRLLGAELSDVELPHARYAQAAGTAIMGPETASWHADWITQRPQDYGADVLERIRTGALLHATEYLAGQKMRRLLRQDFAQAFEQADVIVGPSVAILAPPIGQTFEPAPEVGLTARQTINRLTVPANLCGLPAMSVPCGLAAGLPVGLQIIGPVFEDGLVLRIAQAYERAAPFPLAPLMAA